ncbi:MAG: hypothetical protein WCE29_25250, partial [Mycobacterium sp.]
MAMLAALMTDPDAGHRSAAQIHRRLVADGRGLDLASVPTTVDGIDQEPMDGTSFVHTFDDDAAAAAAEERHTVQYFEMQPRHLPGRHCQRVFENSRWADVCLAENRRSRLLVGSVITKSPPRPGAHNAIIADLAMPVVPAPRGGRTWLRGVL